VLSHVNEQTQRTVKANCIMLILVQNGIPFFVARRHQRVFEYDLGVLRVDTTSERFACFAASSIVQDHPLHAYRVGEGLYIVYKSVLFDTGSSTHDVRYK